MPLPRAVSLFLAQSLLCAAALAQVPGRNVNMVSGTGFPDGDPFLQRQNEPSVAVSTRNPQHLLAGTNDYRTVDLPGLPDGKMVGDAWMGVFKSFDGGQTWRSTLLPGYPQDASPAGTASPLKGYDAAADPVARAGTNGLLYLAGIVFSRDDRAPGRVFVARFLDDNNLEAGDPIRLLGVGVVDAGNAGQFVDKPWVAVDIPRAGAALCRVPSPAQAFPAGNVYVAYTRFVGPEANGNGQLLFSRSTDCGATWQRPTKLSEDEKTNQGASIAVDPNTGAVHVAWRRFASDGKPDAILAARSTDGGRTFTKPLVVAVIAPFDQGTSTASFRTNAYPTMAADGTGRVYIAWAQRGVGPGGDARIVVTSSLDGARWAAPAAADPSQARGHQVMPSLTFAAGALTLAYYDLRDTFTTGVFTPAGAGLLAEFRQPVGDLRSSPARVFNQFIVDAAPPSFHPATDPLLRRHTVDVRVVQASVRATALAPLQFGPGVRVSQYAVGSRPGSLTVEQMQANPPNLPMFRLGTAPFFGDYIDLAGVAFLPNPDGTWRHNTAPSGPSEVHAVWTDNRDVRPPADGNWANYTPVRLGGAAVPSTFDPTQNRPGCVPGQTGMRNQNVYTARISSGLVAGSLGNAKPLGAVPGRPGMLLPRAFSVFAQNATAETRSFRLSITNQPPGGSASFLQFPVAGQPWPLAVVDVTVPPRSSASRTVFVAAPDPRANVLVAVAEIAQPGAPAPLPSGLQAPVLLNPDVTNPTLANPDVTNPDVTNPDVTNVEVYNPDVTNPDVTNPDVTNPDVTNPVVRSPDVTNVVVFNPDVTNPTVSNPDVTNPTIANPDVTNPTLASTSLVSGSLTDTTWTVTNTGNTTAAYSLRLLQSVAPPNGFVQQLIVHRTYLTPVASACELRTQVQDVPVVNVTGVQFAAPADLTRPAATDPGVANATVTLAPGESAKLTLRVLDPNRFDSVTYDAAASVTPAVVGQAVNTGAAATQPPVALVALTASLPVATVVTPYAQPLQSLGGVGPYTWSLAGGALPTGLTLSSGGQVSGIPAASGSFPFTARVTDARGAQADRALTVVVVQRLAIGTPNPLPGGSEGVPYSTILAATGGLPPYTWSLAGGALPAGLTLTPTSGAIQGAPAATNTTATLRVTDSLGNTASGLFSISVIGIFTASLPRAGTGSPYSQTLSVTGGVPPFAWSVASGSLPTGLALSSAGILAGTPSQSGTFPFTARVTGGNGISAMRALALTVAGIGPAALPEAAQGEPYSLTLQAVNAVPPVGWSLALGSPPAGLSLGSASGTLAGIPLGVGSSTFVAQYSDGTPLVVSRSLTVQVQPPAAVAGYLYSVRLAPLSGTGPFTWALAPNSALPAGMTLAPDGLLSGRPTAAGQASVTALVTDSSPTPATASLPLAVRVDAGLPVVVSNVSLNGGGTAISVAAGTIFNASFDYAISDAACPNCVNQIQVGLSGGLPQACAYNGIPGPAGASGSASLTLTAPGTPGTYYLGIDRSQAFSCRTDVWWSRSPGPTMHIGTVTVGAP